MRTCGMCGASLEGEHGKRIYCKGCKNARSKQLYQNKKETKDRYCQICGTSINDRHALAKYCFHCLWEIEKERNERGMLLAKERKRHRDGNM